MSNYTIPTSLRRKPDIDQVLQYGSYYRDAEDEYIRLLSKEQEFMSRYPNEFSKFKSQFKYEKPKKHEVSSSVLYNVMAERKQSSVYDQAIIQFWFLCQATKECDRLTSYRNSAQSSATQPFSTRFPTSKFKIEESFPSVDDNVQDIGRQQSDDLVLTPDHGDLKSLEEREKKLKKIVNDQGDEIKRLFKKEKENLVIIGDLRNSAHIDKETIKQLKQKTEELSRLLTEDRELNENVRTKNHKELTEKDQDITELRNEKERLKDETKQLKQELKKSKNKAQTGVDKTETTASEQTDINIAPSPNRFAQCPIVEGKWSSEKDTELLSLQEQNKSYEESMMSMLKAKRIKEDENSKLKTKVQQLERDFLKKAKEVDSLKIEKQTLEERLNKQTKE